MFTFDPEARGIALRRQCAEQLKDKSSDELSCLVKEIFQRHSGEAVDKWYLSVAPADDDLFMAAGACDVLKERLGEQYIEKLTGLRKPKTLYEKAMYFFTGKMPIR